MLCERALHRAKLRHQFLDLAALQRLGENPNRLADEVGAVAQRVGDAGADQAGTGPEQRDTVAVRGVGVNGIGAGAVLEFAAEIVGGDGLNRRHQAIAWPRPTTSRAVSRAHWSASMISSSVGCSMT